MKKLKQFKVLDHCIACTTCSKASPEVFALNEPCTIAIVTNQPTNPQSIKKSFQALKSCPVSAIRVSE